MPSPDAAAPDTPRPTPCPPAMAVGGGFIVLRRSRRTGRLRAGYAPFEHGTRAEAEAEALRLARQYRCEFVVFEAGPSVFPPVIPAVVPTPGDGIDAVDAADAFAEEAA